MTDFACWLFIAFVSGALSACLLCTREMRATQWRLNYLEYENRMLHARCDYFESHRLRRSDFSRN